jgi:hypothetical protein
MIQTGFPKLADKQAVIIEVQVLRSLSRAQVELAVVTIDDVAVYYLGDVAALS